MITLGEWYKEALGSRSQQELARITDIDAGALKRIADSEPGVRKANVRLVAMVLGYNPDDAVKLVDGKGERPRKQRLLTVDDLRAFETRLMELLVELRSLERVTTADVEPQGIPTAPRPRKP